MQEDRAAAAAPFQQVRSRLFGLAYRMLGSRAEAEDIVQECYVRWHQADRASVREPEAWLVTTATRLAIDRLRALQREREAYAGPWLPEPLTTAEAARPDRDAELASDLSIAFLVLLERLAPEERAAFLLHDVFDCGYDEIARVLDRSEAACRQVVHRARGRLRTDRRRFEATTAQRVALLNRFTAAVEARDEKALLALFASDATWTADGGGRVPAAPRPIVGAHAIVRLVLGIRDRFWRDGGRLHPATVNGEPGLSARIGDQVMSVMAFDSDGDRITAVYAVVNPAKLERRPPA